jgi:tetratricopeptide (TPR) repeat protein/DNA-binding winged helix-turn-helix (wHTH) protein
MNPSGATPATGGPTYRCEDVEIDSAQGYLKRGGQEQYLRQQSFHVLLYLLERRQRPITKEELIQNFWHDTAVTDNALVQCIAEIRRALGDDPRQARFVKTIPKVGYRFISPVEEEAPAVSPVPASDLAEPVLPEVARAEPWFERRLSVILMVLGLAAGTMVLWLTLRHPGGPRTEVTLPRVPGTKPLAVMYFENQSGRPDLNWLREGLADMFITGLARSEGLTVLSRQQLHLLLERVGHKPASDISLDAALDLARRSHAEAVLLGSFAALGEQILISVQLFDTSNGQPMATDRLVADRPANILSQIDLLSLKLAARLGVAPSDPGKKASLAEVMTNSLEAYRYYSLGVSKAQAFENAGAVELLRKAIQLDPNFAMAYARIGYAYSVTDFLPEKGRPFLEKAFQMSDRLTEKDRLYVAAWYAIARQDYASAIQTLRRIVDQYPLETEAYARLGRLLFRKERPNETIAVVQRGLAIDSEAKDLYNVLGVCFLGLGRYDKAIAAHHRYVQLAPSEPNAHDSLGMSYQQSGRYDKAAGEYNVALSLDPEFEPAIIHLGDVYTQQGRYRDAVSQYQRYIQVTRSDTARAVGYGSIAQVYRRKRDFRQGEEAAQREMSHEKRAIWNSLQFALDRGDTAGAANLKRMLFQNVPYPERGVQNELRSHDYYLGTLALRARQPDEAIRQFRQALRHLPPSSGLDLYEDCLANAYLEFGHLDEAIDEYQRILQLNPNYPLAQYHLGQAFERKGKVELAQAAYERFLQNWKSADADIPEIMEAKKQFAARMAAGLTAPK